MLLALLISPPVLADDLFVGRQPRPHALNTTRLKQSPAAVLDMMVGNLSGNQAALPPQRSMLLDNRYGSRRALYFITEMSF